MLLGLAMVCCLVSESAAGDTRLADIARACSPRVEAHGDRAVVFDVSGLGRVIGTPIEIAREVKALAVEHGLGVRVAIAATRVAAWLLSHTRPGVTVVEPAGTSAALAGLPVTALATLPGRAVFNRQRAAGPLAPGSQDPRTLGPSDLRTTDALVTLTRWGLRTLGQVAALPRADVRTRLGADGVRLHQAACGEDPDPLVPAGAAAPFLERCVLEWPIEGMEPLTFVLARLCDALAVSLERADRGAVTVTTSLQLVSRETHQRTLNLPAPMRDARTLRTLIRLDLESHPPGAAIDVVTVVVEVVPGRIVQGSLLDRALPAPEHLATLTARLGALVGEARVGAPAVLDSHDDRGAGMHPFVVAEAHSPGAAPGSAEPDRSLPAAAPLAVVRRFRLPIAARVVVERGGPVRVVPATSAIAAARIVHRAGPWRSSGRWWTTDRAWDRDEWDVELAGGGCYRLARDRATGQWEIEGEND
jgi:protein ImuB